MLMVFVVKFSNQNCIWAMECFMTAVKSSWVKTVEGAHLPELMKRSKFKRSKRELYEKSLRIQSLYCSNASGATQSPSSGVEDR